MARVWSPQQTAFLDWAVNGAGSCVLEAVAGSGKTTTIIEAAKRLAPKTVAIVAYNSKISVEIKEKVSGIPHIEAGTLHSFGWKAVRKTFNIQKPERYKVANLLVENQIIPDNYSYTGAVAQLISLAKQRGLGVIGKIDDRNEWWGIAEHFDIFTKLDEPYEAKGIKNEDRVEEIIEERNEQIISLAIRGLKASNADTTQADFDDQVYLPLLYKLRLWQYDVVVIDEAQDTNPARRELAKRLLKPNGRLIAVGDRHQAIYGFTGADNDSLDLIVRDFNAIRMPLSVTYRCPKAVVAFSKQWVNHIEAHEGAKEGSISKTNFEEFVKRTDLNGDAAVLCRVTAPLVKAAFALIRARVACKIEGRDIGQGLIKLVTRWKRVKTLSALSTKLEDYLDRETTKWMAKKKDDKVAQVKDTVETLQVIIDQCQKEGKKDVSAAVDYINSLFAEDVHKLGILVLSTIHKSKGREWKRVFWYDRSNTCPSKWAKQEWQKEQEINLQYVAATRAMEELIDLTP